MLPNQPKSVHLGSSLEVSPLPWLRAKAAILAAKIGMSVQRRPTHGHTPQPDELQDHGGIDHLPLPLTTFDRNHDTHHAVVLDLLMRYKSCVAFNPLFHQNQHIIKKATDAGAGRRSSPMIRVSTSAAGEHSSKDRAPAQLADDAGGPREHTVQRLFDFDHMWSPVLTFGHGCLPFNACVLGC